MAALVWIGANMSNQVGYLVALLSMVMIIVALRAESIWPKQRKPENTVVFALFWGCMLGAVLPHLVSIVLDGGFEALYELYISEP